VNIVGIVAVDLVEPRIDVILGALDSNSEVLERFPGDDDLLGRRRRIRSGRRRFLGTQRSAKA
jgi:hypothetical protein